ncbi:MAG TPA: hypothetical protein VFI29_09585 [Hanamia sp.]|nr:hypothetical protein [Hanamia sp.]
MVGWISLYFIVIAIKYKNTQSAIMKNCLLNLIFHFTAKIILKIIGSEYPIGLLLNSTARTNVFACPAYIIITSIYKYSKNVAFRILKLDFFELIG